MATRLLAKIEEAIAKNATTGRSGKERGERAAANATRERSECDTRGGREVGESGRNILQKAQDLSVKTTKGLRPPPGLVETNFPTPALPPVTRVSPLFLLLPPFPSPLLRTPLPILPTLSRPSSQLPLTLILRITTDPGVSAFPLTVFRPRHACREPLFQPLPKPFSLPLFAPFFSSLGNRFHNPL